MEPSDKFVKIFFIFFAFVFFMPFIMAIGTMFPNLTISPLMIVLIIIAVVVIWIVATYNKFVALNQRVKQAQGGIDVYLKQRFDLIPNLVETVKGFAAHEKELMENIAKLRQDYDRYTRILAMVENYTELKSNEAFLKLQKSLSKIESQLQAARRIYNSEVTEFNTKRYKFPSNIIANVFGFSEKTLFEIADSERENVNINI